MRVCAADIVLTTTFVPPTLSRAASCRPVCVSPRGADGKPAVIRQGAGLAASPVPPTGAAPPLSSSTRTQININIFCQQHWVGGDVWRLTKLFARKSS